ncbi:hypothetical protein FQN49_006972 [Arthroderma sp. PD_2]|nr:hypothetical protein FQN49_006972 [Arthroderma sp. PD_2]
MWRESDIELLDGWIKEGNMIPERILERLTEARGYGGLQESEYIGIKRAFASHGVEEAGTVRLGEDGFISFLKSSSTTPSLLNEAGNILYSSLLYLSKYPFQLDASQTMTLGGFSRAILWALIDHPFGEIRGRTLYAESNFCRGRTPADYRRAIFQSLATSRDGIGLPYDEEEWKKQAKRRAYQFDRSEASHIEFAGINCDEDGDEMYHDVLDILYSSQIEIHPCLAPVYRDRFRPLAKKLHGNHTRLHHLTIPQDSFQRLVKLFVSCHFGPNSRAKVEDMLDLDQVSWCITKAFARNPDIGITWPMFDEACKVTPWLLDGYHILSSFFDNPDPTDYMEYAAPDLPNPIGILTFPIMGQLGIMFSRSSFAFYHLRRLQSYDPRSNEINISMVTEEIHNAPDTVYFLVSGKEKKTGEISIFGLYIAVPSKDGDEIQSTEVENVVNMQDTCLFQLSPIHDMYSGNRGLPGWTTIEDRLCFGDRDNGAALELSNGCRAGAVFHNVSGKGKPVYDASEWRGDWKVEFDVESIELWVDDDED